MTVFLPKAPGGLAAVRVDMGEERTRPCRFGRVSSIHGVITCPLPCAARSENPGEVESLSRTPTVEQWPFGLFLKCWAMRGVQVAASSPSFGKGRLKPWILEPFAEHCSMT